MMTGVNHHIDVDLFHGSYIGSNGDDSKNDREYYGFKVERAGSSMGIGDGYDPGFNDFIVTL